MRENCFISLLIYIFSVGAQSPFDSFFSSGTEIQGGHHDGNGRNKMNGEFSLDQDMEIPSFISSQTKDLYWGMTQLSSFKTMAKSRKVMQCNGHPVLIDPDVFNIDSKCSRSESENLTSEDSKSKTKAADSTDSYESVKFNCRVACRLRQQGLLDDNGGFKIDAWDNYIDSAWPKDVTADLKVGFRRCTADVKYVQGENDKSCTTLAPIIGCLRRAYYESCDEFTEDLLTNYYPGSYNKFISYSDCQDQEVKWPEDYQLIDTACKQSEISYTCHQRCLWQKAGLLQVGGNKNWEMIIEFITSVYPGSAVAAIKKRTQECHNNHHPGHYDPANLCTISKPFYKCIHRAMFKTCRSKDYLIPYPEQE